MAHGDAVRAVAGRVVELVEAGRFDAWDWARLRSHDGLLSTSPALAGVLPDDAPEVVVWWRDADARVVAFSRAPAPDRPDLDGIEHWCELPAAPAA